MLVAMGLGTLITLSMAVPWRSSSKQRCELRRATFSKRFAAPGQRRNGALADAFRGLLAYIKDVAQAAVALGSRRPRAQHRAEVGRRRAHEEHGAHDSHRAGAARRREDAHRGGTVRSARPSCSRQPLRGRLRGARWRHEPGARSRGGAHRRGQSRARKACRAGPDGARAGQFPGEYGRMLGSLGTATESLEWAMLQVSSAAEQVASASTQIAASSQSVAQGASEQASALEETLSALVEMSSSTNRRPTTPVRRTR